VKVTGFYSHKGGQEFIEEHHSDELQEVIDAVSTLDAVDCLRKSTSEKTKPNLLFSPTHMNHVLKTHLCPLGWTENVPDSKKGFREPRISIGAKGGRAFREMDGIKNKVGLEIQFGKYAFMGYDIFSKMPIFANRNLISCGIELVVMPSMILNMSTGVSSFTQITDDMDARGVADIDIPTVVLGMEYTEDEWEQCLDKRRRYETDKDNMLRNGEVGKGMSGAKPGPK